MESWDRIQDLPRNRIDIVCKLCGKTYDWDFHHRPAIGYGYCGECHQEEEEEKAEAQEDLF